MPVKFYHLPHAFLQNLSDTAELISRFSTDSTIWAPRGWFPECGYSWTAAISLKTVLDRRGRSG